MLDMQRRGEELQKEQCYDRESNTGPSDLQSDALPTELSQHMITIVCHQTLDSLVIKVVTYFK